MPPFIKWCLSLHTFKRCPDSATMIINPSSKHTHAGVVLNEFLCHAEDLNINLALYMNKTT